MTQLGTLYLQVNYFNMFAVLATFAICTGALFLYLINK